MAGRSALAAALVLGAGRAGFYIVAAWQGLTFAWHALRTIQLGAARGGRIPEA